jgi:phosphohistidine phosphatase
MTRNLFLVRHAQPHHDQLYNSDKERELKPEGILEASQLGKYLLESKYNIDLIIASDSVRTTATATLIARTINYPSDQIMWSEKIYSGSLNDLLEVINRIPDTVQHLLLVGHNPTISELHNYLTGLEHANMSTCELNLIGIEIPWQELTGNCGQRIINYQPFR